MKRLITLSTIMLLLAFVSTTASAGASVEIHGDFDNWGSGVKMKKLDDSNFTYDFTYTESFQFKFKVTDGNGIWLGTYDENGADPDAYYFVSPELTNGKMLEAFKLSPSRLREGKDVLTDRWSFNIQDFLLGDKSEITYYIAKGDGSVTYRPYENNYVLGSTPSKVEDNFKGNGTIHQEYEKCDNNSNTSNLFKLDRTGFKNKGAVSYTWLLYTGDNKYEDKLEILINKTAFGGSIDEKGYYLVGNFTGAGAKDPIYPTKKEHRRLMRQYWFKDGIAYTTKREDADSIVYRATVTKPTTGEWKNLYLAVFGATDIAAFDAELSDKNTNPTNWNKAIRPQEQWAYDCDSNNDSDGDEDKTNDNDGLDATALHGGLFAIPADGKRANQALNPNVDNKYDSYTFSMNVTTSTYRIVFNENLYIMGPAVGESNSTGDGWDTSAPDTQTAHAYKLVYNPKEQCYTYHGENGTLESAEQPIPLTAGKEFAFVYNKNFLNIFFEEDDVVPVSLIDTEGNSTEIYTYSINNEAYDPYKDNDTQYVNFLRTSTSNETEYNEQKVNACKFNLPTGEYYIRLYIRQDPQNPDISKVYYVIHKREYTFYWPDADAAKLGGYTTFKSFCDYHAVVIPNDIDVFTVNSTDETKKEAYLSPYEFETERFDNVRVLPAETPVILAKKQDGNRSLKQDVTMEYYKEPNMKATETAIGIEDNMLKGQISRKHIEETDDNGQTHNFLFGYRKLNDEVQKVTIGFYAPGDGECSINTAYLQLGGNGSNNANSWKLVLEDNEATGIDRISGNGVSKCDDAYYTLQGVKVTTPMSKGIYIHNNKKIIIK